MTLARPCDTSPNGISSYHAPLPTAFPVTPRLRQSTSTPLLAGPILLLRLLLGPRPPECVNGFETVTSGI
jgi:hypothetical protein